MEKHTKSKSANVPVETDNFSSSIIQLVHDAIIVMDEDQNIILFNQGAEKTFGYIASEVIGQRLDVLLPPQVFDFHVAYVRSFAKDAETARLMGERKEVSGRRKNGVIFPAEASIAKVSSGGKIFFTAILRDITERKIVEQALRESEEKQSMILNGVDEIIYQVNYPQGSSVDGTVEFVSEQTQEILGFRPTDFITDPTRWRSLIHPEDIPAVQSQTASIMKTGLPGLRHYRIKDTNGEYRWMEDRVSPEKDKTGKVVRTFGVARDITERKQAEVKLRLQATALDTAANAVFITDREGIIQWVNPAFSRITGFTVEQAVSRTPRILKSGLYPREFYEKVWRTILAGDVWQGEMINRHRAGNHYTVHQTVTPLRGPEGEITHFVAIQQDITERKRTEEQLHDSEERFRTTFEQAAVGIAHVGTNGSWLRVNQRLCDIVGYTRDELPGLTFQDITHPDDLQTDLNYVHQMLADEIKVYSMEKRYIRKDRSIVWINLTVSLVRETSGEPKYFISVVEDITEHKQAEVERAQLLNVLESSLNEIYIFDAETLRFQYVNQGALRNLGYTREAMSAMTPLDLKPEFDEVSFRKVIEPLLRLEQEKLIFHTVHRRADDSHYPVEVHLQLSDYEGKRVFHAVILDITERKRAEEEAAKLHNAVEQSADITMITDQDGIIEYVNPAFEAVTGYSKAEAVGKSPRILNSEMMEAGYYQKIWMTILLGEVFRGEVIDRKKSGELFYYDQTITPLKDTRGNITHFVSTGKDVTERKQAEQEIQKLNAELEQRVAERTADLNRANIDLERSVRVKDEFLANMSHELRTPLTGILGLSESLEEQIVGPLNEKQEVYVHNIRESGHHLLTLINDILDLAKIEAGQITLDFSKVEIRLLCESGLRMVKELAQKKHQDIGLEIDDGLGLIWADNRRLKQMIINLLSNAIKFTPEGGKTGLEVHGYRDENKMTITVWDSGIGITENDLTLLFQPFVQLDSSLARESTGTGLGLALVAQMARLHGGSVNVASEPGKGSRFTISLPWEPALATDTTSRRKVTGKLPAIKPGENRRTILLVEDTDQVIMVIRDYLGYAGYKVESARNGMDGIAQAKKVHPDLILMDVQMPVMDGLEAAQRLRSETEFQYTPIIALTAFAMQGDRERCLAAGMDEYISKPVNLKALLKMIQNFLSGNEGD
ncbi:MAG: PAS domain S-box protein [Chloroflexota bacterium]